MRLPDHLVEWLLKFAKQTARTPDQLLAYILELYYQIWKIGYDAGHEELNVDGIIENYVKYLKQKNLSPKTISKRLKVSKKFLRWCVERRIDLTTIGHDHVNLFLNELNVSKTTKSLYRSILKSFLDILPDLI